MASHDDVGRLHALDGVRAAMMLLGLVLHSAASYTATPLGAAWPYQDRSTTTLFDFVVFIVHLFRMPTFFVMAGFFAALLYDRSGPGGLLAHRARRVLGPLALAWVVVFPLVGSGFAFTLAGGGAAGLAAARTALASPYGAPRLVHLWFLYDLLIFYLAAVVMMPVVHRLPTIVTRLADRGVGTIVLRPWGLLAAAMITTLTLIPMDQPALQTSDAFLPPLRVLVAYFVFFAFGWLLFNRRELVASFSRWPWWYCAAGLGASAAYLSVVLNPPFADPLWSHLAGCAAGSLAMWLLIYAAIGVFVRHFGSPRPMLRYLADSAYWIYLVHLPFVIVMPGLLSQSALPALGKFLIVVGATTFVTVVTYHYFVRSTAIGALLNGRRYSRAFPTREPVGARSAVSVAPAE